MKEHIIDKVIPGSIGEELEVESGDRLVSINGNEILDVLDYHYHMNDEYLVVVIKKADGEEWELEVEKEYEEDLGFVFDNGMMDEYRSCKNKCMFCFVDQMPPGMRETLYFKDDDARLSFLQGNYITLTNLSERDVKRIIDYKLGPINISVHTTNKDLRNKMLHNRFAGDDLAKMDQLFSASIPMNGQIVLCKNVNDREELERTIKDLTAYIPVMESVSIVPVGLSKHREGLYPLESFTKEDAALVLHMIHHWQNVCYEKHGLHFIHASDEWYLLAEESIPEKERYDGYLQLENGVGMLRLLHDEFMQALEEAQGNANIKRTVSIATGYLAADFLKGLTSNMKSKFPNITIHIYPIRNDFFGEKITVSGLLTGQDIISQLKGKNLGEELLLPCSMMKNEEEVFLDDITVGEMKKALQVSIDIVKSDGQYLLDGLCGYTGAYNGGKVE